MGAYLLNSEVISRIGAATAAQLTTDTGTTADTVLIDTYISGAEGETNGYLTKRYQTPIDLTALPELANTLREVVINIVVYKLMARRPPVSQDYRDLNSSAIDWLTKVSRGEIVLPAAATPPSATADKPMQAWKSSTPNASREEMI